MLWSSSRKFPLVCADTPCEGQDVILFLQTQMVGGSPPSPPLLLPSQRVDFPPQGQALAGKVSKLLPPFLRAKAELVKSKCLPEELQQHEQTPPVTTLSSGVLDVPGKDPGSSGREDSMHT